MSIIESSLETGSASTSTTIPAGEPWLGLIKAGQVMRIVDLVRRITGDKEHSSGCHLVHHTLNGDGAAA